MLNYKFSIIMPAYNAEDTIEHAIASLKSQSFADFDCIAIDDGSKDGTYDAILNAISGDHRFKVLSNGQNLGLASTINKGIDASSNEWIVVLESDDALAESCLDDMHECIAAYDDLDFVQLGISIADPNGKTRMKVCKTDGIFKIQDPGYFKHINKYWQGKALNASRIKQLGLKANPKLRTSIDYDFILRYILQSSCYVNSSKIGYLRNRCNGGHIQKLGISDKEGFEQGCIVQVSALNELKRQLQSRPGLMKPHLKDIKKQIDFIEQNHTFKDLYKIIVK